MHAKLLLALDDNDILGMLQANEYYALRPRECKCMLCTAVEEYLNREGDPPLYLNFAFGLILAKHMIELEGGCS
eukprot:scaffold282_cov345-Pavlova_lutheri.AAC.10